MNNTVKLRGQSLILLSMLAVQFVLGMVLNLFVQLPKLHPGTNGSFGSRAVHVFAWAVTNGGGIALLLHVIIAIGLLIGSLIFVVRTVASKSKSWQVVSVIGAVGVLAALTNGLAFLGYSNDVNSFVMAIGFVTATTAYSAALSFAIEPSKTRSVKTKTSPSFVKRFKPSHG